MTDEINNTQGYTSLDVGEQQSNNNNYPSEGYEGCKVHYRTPINTFHCIACPIGIFAVLLFGSLFTFILIEGEKRVLGICGIIFITLWGLGFISASGLGVVCISIDIDPKVKEIVIKTRKMCFCCGKKKVFEFNNIQKIFITKDSSYIYTTNNEVYYSFKMEILLSTNEVIRVFSGVIDKNNESTKVYDIFRDSLPSNIIVEIDLNN